MEISGLKLDRPTASYHDGAISEGTGNDDHQEWLFPVLNQWLCIIPGAGNSSWKKGHYWRREKYKNCSIELVTAGNLLLSQNGKEYLVKPGQVFILHKGANHTYVVGPAGFVHKRYVWLDGSAADTLFEMSGLDGIDVLTVDDAGAVMRIMRSVKRVLREKPPDHEKQLSNLAFALVNELIASSFDRHTGLVQKTIDFVHANQGRYLTNDTIAAHAGVSSGYLIRQFRREMGHTPLEYHLQIRINAASHLLRMTDNRIKEIATRTGFKDPLYFSKVYKMNTGVSPREFRTALKAGGTF